MKFALLMFADPNYTRAMTRADLDRIARKHEALRDELGRSGELIGGAGLDLPDQTTLVRLERDLPVTSRGPLAADAGEHLTAYYEVECESAERAREIGEHLLDDHVTSVEVRHIHDTA